MIKSSSNPSAIRSRRMLQKALLKLMNEKPYSDITISDITSHADLARRTFYRHYDEKIDILDDIFEDMHQDYIRILSKEETLQLPDITHVFFTFFSEQLEILQLLHKNDLLWLLLKKLNGFIPHIYDVFKGQTTEYDSPETLKYALQFSIGGHFNALMLWLQNSASKKPSEMKKIIQKALEANYMVH